MPGKIFGPKKDEFSPLLKILRNEKLSGLCRPLRAVSIVKTKRMGWAGDVLRMGEIRNTYRIFFRKSLGKRPSGRPRTRWDRNIKPNLKYKIFMEVIRGLKWLTISGILLLES